MYKKSVVVLSVLLLAACSNSVDTQTAAKKQEVVKNQPDEATKTKVEGTATTKVTKDSDLICRTERPLGTRFGKKVCRTRSQVEEERKQAKDLMPRHRECTGPSEVCI